MSVLDLEEKDRVEALERVEKEVAEVEKRIVRKTLTSNMAIVLQTVALIITLISLAVAADRRITIIEVKTATEIQARVTQDQVILDAIQRLQDVTKSLSENQVRAITILDVIDKRHALEDQRLPAPFKIAK
jgi:hypothetical protein